MKHQCKRFAFSDQTIILIIHQGRLAATAVERMPYGFLLSEAATAILQALARAGVKGPIKPF
jgi:hypothetical protein